MALHVDHECGAVSGALASRQYVWGLGPRPSKRQPAKFLALDPRPCRCRGSRSKPNAPDDGRAKLFGFLLLGRNAAVQLRELPSMKVVPPARNPCRSFAGPREPADALSVDRDEAAALPPRSSTIHAPSAATSPSHCRLEPVLLAIAERRGLDFAGCIRFPQPH